MTVTYQYFVKDFDLAESEISEEAADAMRVGDWESSTDLPEGLEYAHGRDNARNIVRLHRVEADGERESYLLAGPPVVRRRTFNGGEVSFSGGPFDGEVVPIEFGAGAGPDSTPEFPLALSICLSAVDGTDGKSIIGRRFSDGESTYKVESVGMDGNTIKIKSTYLGRYMQ